MLPSNFDFLFCVLFVLFVFLEEVQALHLLSISLKLYVATDRLQLLFPAALRTRGSSEHKNSSKIT